MRPLVILRPAPGNAATARAAQALGLTVIAAPLFATVAVGWDAPCARFDGVMMTSANAARLGGPALAAYHALPLYAVGAATAAAARAAGFADVRTGSSNAEALTGQIAADGRTNIVHLAGRDRTAVPRPARCTITTVTVYASDPLPAPALPAGGVALLHSVRAAQRLAALVRAREPWALVTISAAVAAAAAGADGGGWDQIVIAARPDDAAMLELAARLCQT
jgi:uroporphyrinogen-III synthase